VRSLLTLLLLTNIAAAADVPLPAARIVASSYGSSAEYSASNGREFLVVCAQQRGTIFTISGIRVDERGTPIDRMFVIVSDATHPLTPFGIASDGDGYLVLYRVAGGAEASFVRLDDRGHAVLFGTLPQSTTSIAWAGSAYVAGCTSGRDAIAVIVDAGGTTRSTPMVRNMGRPDTLQLWPGTAGNAIATWTGNDGRIHAVAAPVSSLRNGTFAAPAADESGPVAAVIPSAAALASNDRESLVIWSEPNGVHAFRLDGNGHAIGDPFVVASLEHEAKSPTIAIAAFGSSFLVAWSDSRNIHLATVDDDRITPIFDQKTFDHVPLALSSGAADALVIWNQIQQYGVFVEPGAAPHVSQSRIYSLVSTSQFQPAAVWCGDAHRVVWSELGSPAPVFARVRADGTLIDTESRTFSDDSNFSSDPAIACADTSSLVIWNSYRLPGGAFVRGAIVDADGTPSAAFDIGRLWDAVPSILQDYAPAVVWNGSEYLVAWWSAVTRRINLVRVARDGHVLDVVPQVLQSVAGSVSDDGPSLAWNGSEYLLAWTPGFAPAHGLAVVRLSRELIPIGTIREIQHDGNPQDVHVVAGDGEWGLTWSWRGQTQFATLTPTLDTLRDFGAVGRYLPLDLTHDAAGYRIASYDTVVTIGAAGSVAQEPRSVAALSHGGPLLEIVNRLSDDELVLRLYASAPVARARPSRR